MERGRWGVNVRWKTGKQWRIDSLVQQKRKHVGGKIDGGKEG